MLGRLYDGQDCSAARSLELVGERWSLLILRDALFRNSTRFSQFQSSLGIAPNVLAKRLDSFVQAGIMRTAELPGRPDKREYVLTDMGQDLKPVVMALTAWGDRWVRPGPVTFEHAACGGTVASGVHCTRCASAPAMPEVRARRLDSAP